MEHGTWNMEHRTYNIEHRTWNMEHGTWNMEHRTCIIYDVNINTFYTHELFMMLL